MNVQDHAKDERLLERMRNGDEAAFQELYNRHKDTTFRFACLLMGSTEHAEDVTHDCFLGLIRNPGRYNPRRASLRTYLYGAARNLAMHRLRRAGTERAAEDATDPQSSGDFDQPLVSLLDRELADKIRSALALLLPQQREVIILFEYEEQSLNEIAETIGVEVSTVKWRLHEARQNLRRVLAPYLNGSVSQCREKSNHA